MDKFLSGETNVTESFVKTTKTDDIEMLLDMFDPEILSPSEAIITYWETEQKNHPQLYKLAKVVFAIPPTEVEIERNFSKLNYIFNDRRCRLTQERLEDIMIINLNPDLFNEVKNDEILELKDEN